MEEKMKLIAFVVFSFFVIAFYVQAKGSRPWPQKPQLPVRGEFALIPFVPEVPRVQVSKKKKRK